MTDSTRLQQACWVVVVCWGLLFQTGAKADQPRFYLSTQRIFSALDKDITVQLEARGLSNIDFRLYRIPDPTAFFLKQQDPHRVQTQYGPKRASSLDVISEVRRLSLNTALELARGELTQEGRTAGRKTYPEQIQQLHTEAERIAKPSTAIGLLAGFELIDIWQEDLSSNGSGWVYKNVPIQAREAGVYLVEAVYGHEVGYTIVILSKITLMTRQSKNQLLVWAADSKLGTPLPDIEVQLVQEGQVIGRGTTDELGVWEVKIPLMRELLILAKHGQDFGIMDPTYHPANVFFRKVYITTERPVYQPGQQVFYKGIVRAYADESYQLENVSNPVEISVRDPNGQTVFEKKLSCSEKGTFDGNFMLYATATLGTYRIVAILSGKEYGGEFKVKTYQKPEYKVEVSTNRKAYVSGKKVQATVRANYFFGPPVVGAQVKVTVYRTRFYIPWWVDADYSWYYSDAEYQNTMRETIEEKTGRLDRDGVFLVDFKTRPDSLDYTYAIEAVVIDASDQVVSGVSSIRVTRARFHLVLEPEYLLNSPDNDVRVLVSTHNFSKQPVEATVKLEITARKGADPKTAQEMRLDSKSIHIGKSGREFFTFHPKDSGTYTIRGTARDTKGNLIQNKTTVYVTSAGGDIPLAPTELMIISDSRSYHVDDQARFLILSPHAQSHVLISVEGGRLYRHKVIRTNGYSAIYEIPIGKAQTPNFFLRVAGIFDGAVFEKRLDVVVPPREKLLDVSVEPGQSPTEPGQEVSLTVTVKDYRGKPVEGAEIALAVVDEAVYSISPEIAVPISKFFFHRKRNDVRGSCSLDFRFYGYGQDTRDKIAANTIRRPVVPGSFKSIASFGLRTKFKDTLKFFPTLVSDELGQAKVKIVTPDNLTTWRATARAITDDTRVGQGTGHLRVSKPTVVRLASPTFLVEGDQTKMGVLVHNYTGQDQSYQVTLMEEGNAIHLTGENKTIRVKNNQLGVVEYEAKANKMGLATLSARAKSTRSQDGLQLALPVRPYGVNQVLLAGGVLDDDNPQARFSLAVPRKADKDKIQGQVTISSGVAPALLASLEYLTGFPYGCTEQTMNRFLPDLVVAKALAELGMKHKELEDKLPQYIHAGLAQLARLQHADGGWGWWQEDATDPYMTAYVVYGLSLAKQSGWPVDPNLLNRGVNRLQHLARQSRLSPTQRTYLIYSLALAGVRYESMLDKLLSKPGTLTIYGKALMSMALVQLGRKEQALEIIGQIESVAHISNNRTWWGDNENTPGWEGDPIETTAQVLRSMLLVKPNNESIPRAVRWLMSVRHGQRWKSTKDTALAVFALVDYLKRFGAFEYNATVTTWLNQKPNKPFSFTKEDIFRPSIKVLANQAGQIGKNQFVVERKGKGSLFYNASVTYFSKEDPIKARGSLFQIRRRLYAVEKKITSDGWTFSKRPLRRSVQTGQEILVVLELTSKREAQYIIIEDPIPAGTQPIDRDRGYKIAGVELQQPRLVRRFKEQHVAFFISRLRSGKRTLGYLLRARVPGSYHQLPARIYPMYDPQFAGNSKSSRLVVQEGS